jgi:hypothetical protein
VGASLVATSVNTSTPNQALALASYVRAMHITPEEATTSRTLAEADSIVRLAQNDQIRANAEADSRRLEAMAHLATSTGFVPGEAGRWVLGLSVAMGLVILVILVARFVMRGGEHEPD